MKRILAACSVFLADAASSQGPTIQTVFGEPNGWGVAVFDDLKEKTCVLDSPFRNYTSFKLVSNGRISRIIFQAPVFLHMIEESVDLAYRQGNRGEKILSLKRVNGNAFIDMNEDQTKEFWSAFKQNATAGSSISLSFPSSRITDRHPPPIVYFQLDYKFAEALLAMEKCPSAYLGVGG